MLKEREEDSGLVSGVTHGEEAPGFVTEDCGWWVLIRFEMSNSHFGGVLTGVKSVVGVHTPRAMVDLKTNQPMFESSRVMREPKLLNDVKCLESFHNMNTNVKIISFFCF